MTVLCAPEAALDPAPAPAEPAAAESAVLVVDDSPVDRRIAGALVVKGTGRRVVYAAHGAEAMEVLAHEKVGAVLTDMQMPEMNGLELVENIRASYPLVPVVLMTAFGSEELAIKALQCGASNYVPKKLLSKELAETLNRILTAAKTSQRQQRVQKCITDLEVRYALENDPALVPPLVAALQEQVGQLGLCDDTAKIRVGVALEESLLNGLYHGNLEVSSELRQDDGDAFTELARRRRDEEPFAARRLWVTAKLSRTEAIFVIRDEGNGFDPSKLPDPTDPANLGRIGGRGLLLIRTFMDDVRFNDKGNEITLVKRRDGKGKKKR